MIKKQRRLDVTASYVRQLLGQLIAKDRSDGYKLRALVEKVISPRQTADWFR